MAPHTANCRFQQLLQEHFAKLALNYRKIGSGTFEGMLHGSVQGSAATSRKLRGKAQAQTRQHNSRDASPGLELSRIQAKPL